MLLEASVREVTAGHNGFVAHPERIDYARLSTFDNRPNILLIKLTP